ncbi:hypothetical protein Hanom_Chr12g01173031 [Helianthus anomalus]
MDGTQVCVLKQTHKVSFSSLLKGQHSMALKPQVRLQKPRNKLEKHHSQDSETIIF